MPWPYGGFHLEAMDAHGGWIGSAVDLARWAAAHLNDLGASHIVVSGESGGGNLTLTVTHKAKRELATGGELQRLDLVARFGPHGPQDPEAREWLARRCVADAP